MNQIPNIEETNTREEVKKMAKWLHALVELKDVEEALHQQLQKDRESCICKDKGVIELLEEQNKEARQKIASLYLPAHEVNHGKDCIECKEIAAYNAALQDAIEVVTLSYHSELDQDKPISTTSAQKGEEVSQPKD